MRGTLFRHFVAIARDRKRRFIRSGYSPAERTQPLHIGRRCESPINSRRVSRPIAEHQFVQAVLLVVGKRRFYFEFGSLDGFQQPLERLLIFKVGLFLEITCRYQIHHCAFPQAPEQLGRDLIIFLHIEEERGERRALERDALFGLDDVILGGPPHQLMRKLAFVTDVTVYLAALDAIQRRLGDVHMPTLDEFLHVAEEKSEQQSANVTPVHIRVGHQNDFVIAQTAGIEIVLADSRSQGGNDGANFLVTQHLVVPRLLHIQDLALERQDGLIAAVAALLGRAACRFALDDEDFAIGGIALLAIGQLPGQSPRIHGGLAASELARLAGRLAGSGRVNALSDDASGDGRMLIEVLAQALVHKLLHLALDVAIQLAFGLPFELRLRQLHRNDRYQAFAHIVAGDGDAILLFPEHARRTGEIVDGARERGTEPGEMRSAIDRVYGIGKRKDVLRVAIVILQRDFHLHVIALAFDVNRRIVKRLLAAIEVLDELHDAAGKAKLGCFVAALILERDLQALIQKGQLAQALREDVVAEINLFENAGIGVKCDLRAGLARLAGDSEP